MLFILCLLGFLCVIDAGRRGNKIIGALIFSIYKEDFTDHVCWFFAREKMLHLGNDPTSGRPLNSEVKTFLI